MVAVLIVVDDKTSIGLLQFCGGVVVIELDNGFHGAVVTLDFALGLGVIRRAPHMSHWVALEILAQGIGDEGGAIIRQQLGAMRDLNARNAGLLDRNVARFLNIL